MKRNNLNFASTILLCGILVLIASCKTSKQATTPKEEESPFKFAFEKDNNLSDVLDKAAKANKLVYLDMSAVWCAPCQLMKRDVYTDARTAAFFNKNYISYIVDAEKGEGPDLKYLFNVTSYPTLLILNAKGREIHRKEGGTFHDALIKFGEEGLVKGREQ